MPKDGRKGWSRWLDRARVRQPFPKNKYCRMPPLMQLCSVSGAVFYRAGTVCTRKCPVANMFEFKENGERSAWKSDWVYPVCLRCRTPWPSIRLPPYGPSPSNAARSFPSVPRLRQVVLLSRRPYPGFHVVSQNGPARMGRPALPKWRKGKWINWKILALSGASSFFDFLPLFFWNGGIKNGR